MGLCRQSAHVRVRARCGRHGICRVRRPELEDRLLAALAARLAGGGEAGPLGSAGLLVADAVAWPVTDLRVDWADEDGAGPIEQLAALWKRWGPQRDDYVTRALHPESAPAYHVPGDPGQPEP